jgi:nucleotide-binding universal stress UspA family protein
MVQHLIVPIDGSDASWRAFDTALALAARCDADVEVVEIADDETEVAPTRSALEERLAQHAEGDEVPVSSRVDVADDSVAATLAAMVDAHPEALVVMSSHGRGRSAALLGSVTEELLRRSYGPMLVVGPHCVASEFDGPIIATVDGSHASEFGLPLAAAWGIELNGEPWIVQVADPDTFTTGDARESAYPARLARRLAADSSHPVQFEILHGHDVASEVTDFARSLGATMIVATTHGRTGMPRFVVGSTAAALVRHASCPVLLLRPPHLVGTTGSGSA